MAKYPKNPQFNSLRMRTQDPFEWQEGCTQDPSLIYEDGAYYAFSTDTFGAPAGLQIRKSTDLMHWEYIGSAFDLENSQAAYKNGTATKNFGGLQSCYDWCVTDTKEVGYGVCTRKDGSMALWSPCIRKGSDGKFWLYFCLTGYFGGSKSVIGLAKSDRVDGGYTYAGTLVQSVSGWVSPNALQPHVFDAEDGKLYLVYGSYGLGIYLLELDPETGLRKIEIPYEKFKNKKVSAAKYFGTQLASGSVEGACIRYFKDIDVLENGEWVKKNYYYLMCSFGSVSSTYSIRVARSEKPTGPYLDMNDNPLVCSTDIGTGSKVMGSFKWANTDLDYYCPGHAEMFVSADGKNMIAYHCRTNYFINKGYSRSSNFHYLYVNQFAFNSDGWIVVNPNRYAGEKIMPVSREELLSVSDGKFEMVVFTQGAQPVSAQRVSLNEDGTITGAYTGVWKIMENGDFSVIADGEEYRGKAMPSWHDTQKLSGITVTAMGVHCGMALYLNSNPKFQ